jgi:hypothetical protein
MHEDTLSQLANATSKRDNAMQEVAGILRRVAFASLTDAATYFGLNHSTIARYENGDIKQPPLGYLACLVKLIGENLEEAELEEGEYKRALMSEVNKHIRQFYGVEKSFQNWQQLCKVADNYLSKRSRPQSDGSELDMQQVEDPISPPFEESPPLVPAPSVSEDIGLIRFSDKRKARRGWHPNTATLVIMLLASLLVTAGVALMLNFSQMPPNQGQSPSTFGPTPGVLKHDRSLVNTPGGINWFYKSGVNLRDFKAEATFHNPYGYPNDEKKRFDYGFMFRKGLGDEGYHLAVGPAGAWFLELWSGPGQSTRLYEAPDGTIKNLKASETEKNKLRLEVTGRTAKFYVNDVLVTTPVAALDVSDLMAGGDVGVATGFIQANTISGKFTQFSDFTVWSLDP